MGSLPYLLSIAQPMDDTVTLDSLSRLVTVGVGTFGRVFLCRHNVTGELYALKEIKKAKLVQLNQTRNVAYERAVMAACRHPFLLQLINTAQDYHKLYMITEYIHGGELFNLLGQEETLSSFHAKFYAACVLDGLAHLHSLNLVYRDLKPENLLIDRSGYIRIVDFGFVKHVPAGSRTYTLCGTPAYIAHEMVKGTGYTHAVDYWALGVLIFEMMCGYAPYEAEDQRETLKNILRGVLTFPDELTDFYARDIIRELLQRDVIDRLGCRKHGIAEIFEHPFFDEIDFPALRKKAIEAPWLPELEADDDVCYFESYEDSDEDCGDGDGEEGDEEEEDDHDDEEKEEQEAGSSDASRADDSADHTATGASDTDDEGDEFLFDQTVPEHLSPPRLTSPVPAVGSAAAAAGAASGSGAAAAAGSAAHASAGRLGLHAAKHKRDSDPLHPWFEHF